MYSTPGNDAFAGGQRISAAPPPSIGQSFFPPPGGGPTQTPTGVSPGDTHYARNNRGSNITIPHARVVPVAPVNTALRDPDAATEEHQTGRPFGSLLEADSLDTGRVAFVFGPRGVAHGAPSPTQSLWIRSRLGSGVDRVDRLCSLEYLQRYFRVPGQSPVIRLRDITTATAADRGDWSTGLLKQVRPILDFHNGCDSKSIEDAAFVDFGRFASAANDFAGVAALHMGIYVYDKYPFLRGRSESKGLVDLGLHSGRFKVSRSLPDQLAVTLLERELERAGLFDWRPDGIVLSKESSGDADADERFDAQLQQLFNVAVQGPATLTNLVGKKELLTLPGDLVFVVMLCDRWQFYAGEQATWMGGLAKEASAAQKAAFETWRNGQFDAGPGDKDEVDNIMQSNVGAQLGNFRVRMSTSSEMINCSGARVPSTGNWKPGLKERMNLGFGKSIAEYIVGGWCIGRVLDSAASRAQGPSGMSNSNPTTYSITVDTHVEWWSGDRLFRKFCNVDGKFKQRGQ